MGGRLKNKSMPLKRIGQHLMSSRRLPLQPLAQQSTLQEGTVENRSVNNRNEREETGNNNMANIVTIDDDTSRAVELNEAASPRRTMLPKRPPPLNSHTMFCTNISIMPEIFVQTRGSLFCHDLIESTIELQKRRLFLNRRW